MSYNIYKELPSKSFSSWFLELAAMASKAKGSSSLPKLELLLKSGRLLSGVLIRLEQNNHEQILMLLSTEEKEKVSFVSAEEITAFTVLELEKFIKEFAPPILSAVTNLELKRRTKATEQALSETTSSQIPLIIQEESLNDEERAVMALTLDLLKHIFEDISSDDLGKTTLKESIKTIELIKTETAQVSLQEGKLTISVTNPLKRTASREKEYLKTQLQGLL